MHNAPVIDVLAFLVAEGGDNAAPIFKVEHPRGFSPAHYGRVVVQSCAPATLRRLVDLYHASVTPEGVSVPVDLGNLARETVA